MFVLSFKAYVADNFVFKSEMHHKINAQLFFLKTFLYQTILDTSL